MINRILGVSALVLGGTAILVPAKPMTEREGTPPVSSHHDIIVAESLAARIIERGTQGLTLVDLRPQSAFESYHIPGAIRLRDADLDQPTLPEETTIVLYDETEASAPRIWLLLKAQGYAQVFVLSGGLDAWTHEVLHPALPPGMNRAAEDTFADRMERSRFFGGSPVPAPTRRAKPAHSAPDSIQPKKESFDIGPGGCFY